MFEIRDATAQDAMGIAIVNVYTWKTTYSGLMPEAVLDDRVGDLCGIAQRIRKQLDDGNPYLVAVAEQTVIGFCLYGEGRNPNFPNAGEIYALYALRGFQGKGVGKALFRTACSRLQSSGFTTLIVNCLAGNPSLQFYRHMGGEVVSKRTDDLYGFAITEDILQFDLDSQSEDGRTSGS